MCARPKQPLMNGNADGYRNDLFIYMLCQFHIHTGSSEKVQHKRDKEVYTKETHYL